MKGQPHFSVQWALRTRIFPNRAVTQDPEISSGSVKGIATELEQVHLLFVVNELSREIELTLKKRLERALKKDLGEHWWEGLPRDVRKVAAWRYKLASRQRGSRMLAPTNIAWLTLGDTLKVIASLDPDPWQQCLDAETKRRKAFDQTLSRVKHFRDYHLAHPKPHRWSLNELSHLGRSISRIPTEIVPREWEHAQHLIDVLSSRNWEDPTKSHHHWSYYHWQLWSDDSFAENRDHIEEWAACPELESRASCSHSLQQKLTGSELNWRVTTLRLLSALDPSGERFFGRSSDE